MADHNRNTISIEQGNLQNLSFNENLDDDGHKKRTGTLETASAHIITAVIGAGVLSLAWATAQLGWLVGTFVLVSFAVITYFTTTLLIDCYRSPDPVSGKRNYTYSLAVRAYLGGWKVQLCSVAQYINLVGGAIGYTITASISMVAVKRSNCFHKHGHQAKCRTSNNVFIIIFGATEIFLSQIPGLHKLSWLSTLATVMSLSYSSIGFGLAIAKVVGGVHVKTTLTGQGTGVDKVWTVSQAIGDVAAAYVYSAVVIEIQDTLKSSPPENKTMKKASLIGISATTAFNMLCGLIGYAAFGNDAPGNFLTGFGFYEPFWLVDFANVCIVVHLVGAFQVFCQPIYAAVEGWGKNKWPESKYIIQDYSINIPGVGVYPLNLFRLVWRTSFVVAAVLIAMIFPFFNSFLGLIGSLCYYPLTIYLPIEMHIARTKIPRYSVKWMCLQMLSYACLAVSLLAAVGSAQGLATAVRKYRPFQATN